LGCFDLVVEVTGLCFEFLEFDGLVVWSHLMGGLLEVHVQWTYQLFYILVSHLGDGVG
jgi:hypothetical protein